MATFNELAVLIATPLGRQLDEPFKAQLKARMKYWRAKLLRDTLNRNPKDRVFFTQRITLPTEEVSASDCGIPLDCKMMRTTVDLPVPVRANNVLFDFVGSVDGVNAFKLVPRYLLSYHLAATYAPLVTMYYGYENRRIVLPKNRLVQWVTVEGIFDDPEEAMALQCAGAAAADCNFDEAEYPVSGELAQQIVQYILQVDFQRNAGNDDKTEIHVDDKDKQPS